MNLAPQIEHQTQPTPLSCVATCIAMAVGSPVAELGVDLSRPFDFDDFGVWLAERGIWMRMCVRNAGRGERFHDGGIYLVGIRSLNVANQDHAVLLDTRGPRKDGPNFNERSGWLTFDPNKGREGKQILEWCDENIVLDFCQLIDRNYPTRHAGSPP